MKKRDQILTDIRLNSIISNIQYPISNIQTSLRTYIQSVYFLLFPNKTKLSKSSLISPFFCFLSILFIHLFLAACADLGTDSSITKKYTVNFQTDGGSAVPSVVLTGGTTLDTTLSQTITAPTKAASGSTTYYFGDWYTVDKVTGHTGKTKYDYTKPVTGNITLYARWYTEQPADKAALQALITTDSGDFNHIDVRKITNMSQLFSDKLNFNGNISGWDVSGVTDMNHMFSPRDLADRQKFNQPIGAWDVSNVTDMNAMFANADKFNQPIGDWNVSNVTNMSQVFDIAQEFNQSIENWNVSGVTNMTSMFSVAIKFNHPIESWNVSSVTNMNGMFYFASKFNQPIGSWDVSEVTDMGDMFSYASAFNRDISGWTVTQVTTHLQIFGGSSSMSGDNKPPKFR
ncbi:BspA family leucine-rich repeat surface protein [Candidatus Haliotispira prima]|uniref:BspA family leucine-rich repeat surface protein n=1 Tax=Candidatus Haliotispira prima TaxID=3034016 RepID=A0ABY8MFE6_9SPIO|nr:BspA family leucine-rich repeat surface protein [Candidatus Haliotispira prima]